MKCIIPILAISALLPLSQIHAQPITPPTPPTPPTATDETNNPSGSEPHKGMTPEEHFQHFSDVLNLTDEQKPKVKAVFDEWRATMMEAKTNAETQLQGILTADQFDKFKKMTNHKHHWRHHEDMDKDSDENNSGSGQSNQQ